MREWLRRIVIAAALIGLTLAGLYEYATHVGRGWLRGEAFFEGRPTSYWRGVVVSGLEVDWESRKASEFSRAEIEMNRFGFQPRAFSSARVLSNDADGILRDLAEDDNEQVAGFARDVLNSGRTCDLEVAFTKAHRELWSDLMRKRRIARR